MIEIKRKSPLPYYGSGVIWLLYALLFPMYRIFDYLIFLASGLIGYFVLSTIFPGKTEYVKVPVTTGDENIDALLREGEASVSEMAEIQSTVTDEKIHKQIGELMEVTDKIFKEVLEDRDDYRSIKRFADFYHPTTMKLLRAYKRFDKTDADGEHISSTIDRIGTALDKILESYKKQYDALFRNQAMDIETDIEVLQQLLKKEGLTSSDFN